MDFFIELLVELVLELVVEGGAEIAKSSKVPKIIRYFVLVVLLVFFLLVIGTMYIVSIIIWKKNIAASILLLGITTSLVAMALIKFRKTYLLKISQKEKN